MSGQLDGLNDLVLDVIVFFWLNMFRNVKHHHGLLTVIHCQWFKADDAGIRHHKTRNTAAHVQASDAGTQKLSTTGLREETQMVRLGKQLCCSVVRKRYLGLSVVPWSLFVQLLLFFKHRWTLWLCQLCSLRLPHKRGVRSASIFRNASKRNYAKQLLLI